MSMRAHSTASKSGKSEGAVLGRSAATGRKVLKPASKTGSISTRAAAAAVRTVTAEKTS